jgi:hypothetical protein
MEAQGDSLAAAVPVPKVSARPVQKSGMPRWDAEQLRLAITAAGGRTVVVERGHQSLHDG